MMRQLAIRVAPDTYGYGYARYPRTSDADRKVVFDTFYNVGPTGKRATVKLITQRFEWFNMNKEINQWCETCISCQKGKVWKHTIPPIGQFVPDGTNDSTVYT